MGLDHILSMERDGNKYYYLHDGISNVVGVTDEEGNLVEEYEYLPFGGVSIKDTNGKILSSSSVGNPYFFHRKKIR